MDSLSLLFRGLVPLLVALGSMSVTVLPIRKPPHQAVWGLPLHTYRLGVLCKPPLSCHPKCLLPYQPPGVLHAAFWGHERGNRLFWVGILHKKGEWNTAEGPLWGVLRIPLGIPGKWKNDLLVSRFDRIKILQHITLYLNWQLLWNFWFSFKRKKRSSF